MKYKHIIPEKIEEFLEEYFDENGFYLYEGHMGGMYTSDESLLYEDIYCEQCGDSDWEIGYFEDEFVFIFSCADWRTGGSYLTNYSWERDYPDNEIEKELIDYFANRSKS